MEIIRVCDERFKKYGRIIKEYDTTELVGLLKETKIPADVVYYPVVKELERKDIKDYFSNEFFGGLEVQIGYCNGHNKKLNALEYHRSSEINVAAQDVVLLVAAREDLDENFTMDTSKVKAFLLPANTPVEIFATTLHYAPCNTVEEGFQCAVILPKDTNCNLEVKKENRIGEGKLLYAKNKWLVAHKEARLAGQGAYEGLLGKNIQL